MTDKPSRDYRTLVRQFPTLTPFQAQPHAHDPLGVKRLALSESPYGPSSRAERAAAAELTRLNLYPHSDGEPLRSAIADHYGISLNNVVLGNGTDELILLIAQATVSLAGLGVTTTNTFAGYAASMEIAGQPARIVPLRDSAIDVDAVIDAMVGPAPVMLANPHNPTGAALNRDQVTALVAAARQTGTVLVLDEAYAEFADPDPDVFQSGLEHIDGGSVVVLRTFSKAYGLAGLRVGYAVGDEAVIAAMLAERNALPYNVNRIALAAAPEALADQEHISWVVSANRRVRASLVWELQQLGIQALPSEANFVLANLGSQGAAVVARMADVSRIHVREMSGLGFPGWARISVPLQDDLRLVLSAIQRARAAVDGQP